MKIPTLRKRRRIEGGLGRRVGSERHQSTKEDRFGVACGFVVFVSHGKVWSLFGFMGLYFFMGWWVCEHGFVVESDGAIEFLVGFIIRFVGGFECWGRQWVVFVFLSGCVKEVEWGGIFVLFKNGFHVYESLFATCQIF